MAYVSIPRVINVLTSLHRNFPDNVELMEYMMLALSQVAAVDRKLLESITYLVTPRCGELRTQKLKSHLMRTQRLKVLSLKPGVGQYTAIHATLNARDFFLAYFYSSGPFTYIFPKSLPISPVLAVANTWFLYGPAE